MKPTSISALAAVATVIAAAAWMIFSRFFADLGPRSWWDLGFPWLLTGVCAAAALWIKSVLAQGKVGQDSSQVHPLRLSRWYVVGTASAWLGACLAGMYAGGLLWAIPQWATLSAAAHDGPIMAVGTVSGILLAASGLWLEKTCRIPTDEEKYPTQSQEMGPSSVGWSYD